MIIRVFFPSKYEMVNIIIIYWWKYSIILRDQQLNFQRDGEGSDLFSKAKQKIKYLYFIFASLRHEIYVCFFKFYQNFGWKLQGKNNLSTSIKFGDMSLLYQKYTQHPGSSLPLLQTHLNGHSLAIYILLKHILY